MAIETILTLKKIDKSLLPLINIWEKNILEEGGEKREEAKRREDDNRKDIREGKKEGDRGREMEGKKEGVERIKKRMEEEQAGGRVRRDGEGKEEEEVRKMVEEGWKDAEEVMEKVKKFEFVVKGGTKKMLEEIFVSFFYY